MKKTILVITLTIFAALASVAPTSAATTVLLSPTGISVKPAQSFNVLISVNPQDVKNYVEKVELNYPADMLQINSFTLSGTWIALTQPGYDLIDNKNGVLIKSAGYPGGFSSTTTFGTVSFSAKKAGNGTITIGKNSLAFEVSSQSALNGTPASFVITAPAAVVSEPSTTQKPVIVPLPIRVAPLMDKPVNVQPIDQPIEQSVTEQTVPTNNSLVANVGGTTKTNAVLIAIISVIIILLIMVYVFAKRKK